MENRFRRQAEIIESCRNVLYQVTELKALSISLGWLYPLLYLYHYIWTTGQLSKNSPA